MTNAISDVRTRSVRLGKFLLRVSFDLALISFTPSVTHRFSNVWGVSGGGPLAEQVAFIMILAALAALLLGAILTREIAEVRNYVIATALACSLSWIVMNELIRYPA